MDFDRPTADLWPAPAEPKILPRPILPKYWCQPALRAAPHLPPPNVIVTAAPVRYVAVVGLALSGDSACRPKNASFALPSCVFVLRAAARSRRLTRRLRRPNLQRLPRQALYPRRGRLPNPPRPLYGTRCPARRLPPKPAPPPRPLPLQARRAHRPHHPPKPPPRRPPARP